jgi:hypothetical protein
VKAKLEEDSPQDKAVKRYTNSINNKNHNICNEDKFLEDFMFTFSFL